MASPAENLTEVTNSGPSQKPTISQIKERVSKELIIALCGAVGSGTDELKVELKDILERVGYIVVPIKISKLISNNSSYQTEGKRIMALQEEGNQLRDRHGKDHLAKLAVQQISIERAKLITEKASTPNDDSDSDQSENKTKKRIAYIIDQLKNPKEVELFKTVYPQNFYLITLIRTEKERRLSLEEKRIELQDIDEIIRSDRKQSEKHGQQVEKTAVLADYFIKNRHNHAANLRLETTRFVELIHGANGVSPRKEEKAMMSAYFASLQSACLSRQVGAAITNDSGRILATGRNDVPEFGGGLYSFESGDQDYRCIHKGMRCYNDLYKDRLGKEIAKILHIEGNATPQQARDLVKSIFDNTKAGDLIEYSRAIHAEMDAIISLARTESTSSSDKILYCTTYPCHNCARHIVAAGIKRVIYIEPYEKSLALKLHDDSITDSYESSKVSFEPYEGVSPARYNAFFRIHGDRKDSEGNAVRIDIKEASHVDPQYLDSYHAYEDKITENLQQSSDYSLFVSKA